MKFLLWLIAGTLSVTLGWYSALGTSTQVIKIEYLGKIIWDQKVYFWNIPSDADIYWYNKINPLLLIAVCLQFCVVQCWMSWSMHVRCDQHERSHNLQLTVLYMSLKYRSFAHYNVVPSLTSRVQPCCIQYRMRGYGLINRTNYRLVSHV